MLAFEELVHLSLVLAFEELVHLSLLLAFEELVHLSLVLAFVTYQRDYGHPAVRKLGVAQRGSDVEREASGGGVVRRRSDGFGTEASE